MSETTLNTSQLKELIKTIASLIDLTRAIKLKAEEDYYHIRVDEYRIGLSVDENAVVFTRALRQNCWLIKYL